MGEPETGGKAHQGSAPSLTLRANFMIREPEIVGKLHQGAAQEPETVETAGKLHHAGA